MSVSSQTSRTGASAGTSTATIRSSRTRPSWSADQRAWEKKRWARLWCQACSRWPPSSMPQTVCSPGWAQNPQASPMKVVKVGVVKQPRKRSSRQVREAGRLRVSIGGGCGSVSGTCCAGCTGGRVLVAGLVDASVFLGQVEGPVGGEVAVGPQGVQLEDGLGALDAPAGAGDVEPVADKVPAGPFDHAGGDRPAAGQGGVVAEVLPLGLEVADAGIDATALLGCQPGIGGLGLERGDDGVCLAGQDAHGVGGDPGFGGRVAVVVEAPGGFPEVFQDVDEVDQDVDRHPAAGGFGLDQLELVAGAVDQHDPGATVGRVTLGGLVEDLGDHLLAGGGDRAGQPLGAGDRPLAWPPTTSATTSTIGGGVQGDGGVRTSWGRRGAGSAS